MTGTPRNDPAFPLMALDLLGNVLRRAASPGELGAYLTAEMRELSGARCVVLLDRGTGGHEDRLLGLNPERHREAVASALAAACGAHAALDGLGFGRSTAVPLRIGSETAGSLLLLGLPDEERRADLQSLLEDLSTLVALVLQNASHYLRQEETIEERTRELREANAALRRTQFAMDHVSQPVCWVTPEGRFSYVNDAVCRLTGATREELLGLAVGDLYPAHAGAGWADHWAELRREGTLRFDVEVRLKDGRTVPIEITANYLVFDGQEVDCAFLRDRTEELRAQAERADMERRLLQAQKMEAIGTLAGGIAHDFNNILTPVMAHAELALMQLPRADPVRDHIAQLLTAAERAAALVRQILDISRRGEERPSPVSLAPLLSEVAKFLRSSLPATIEIRKEIDPACGPVLGDLSRLHQVLLNLCTNARDAMGERGGVLTLSLTGETRPGAEAGAEGPRESRWVRLSVHDTGSGIPAELRERIFEPYFTTKARGKGTGLGLATVHGIVTGLGGEVRVSSTPGAGSTFEVLLPEARVERPKRPAAATLPRGRGQKILVVDDEPAVLEVLERMLSALGYQPSACEAAEGALAALRADPGSFAAALTDYTMPGMNGLDLAARLLELRPDLPILLATGFAESVTEQTVAARGLRGLVMKPYSLQRLGEALAALVGA